MAVDRLRCDRMSLADPCDLVDMCLTSALPEQTATPDTHLQHLSLVLLSLKATERLVLLRNARPAL
jgi:hypothetical protein